MSNPQRRRGGRGSDYGNRSHNWGSPRSGSPGSPGVNGSPRTGRRDQRDRRVEPPTDHDSYVECLRRRWLYVQNQPPDVVTFYKSTEFKQGEPVTVPVVPPFDIERFFGERQQQQRQGQQTPSSHPQLHNITAGLPS